MPTSSRLAVARALLTVFAEERRVPEGWHRALGPEDAAFAQALLGLCLRHWGRLQAWFEAHLRDPQRGAPLGSRIAAGMGLAQLAWLPGVSTHAAVHEAVTLAGDPDVGFPPHKGLVNALLRKAASQREALRDELEGMDAALDRSPFTQRVLDAALASRPSEGSTDLLWRRLQRVPEPTFRVLRGAPPPELAPDPQLPGAWNLKPDAPFPRAWLAAGEGMVQDRSSQALMAFDWPEAVTTILDICAAPGGKTTSLSLRWPDAPLTALERDPRRADRLRANLRERQVRANVLVGDALPWLRTTKQSFDLMLLDAPCSGSGTLQKHPELTWIGHALDLDRLLSLQRSLLNAALARLAPGGLLVYAVCSWLPEEGLAHRQAILDQGPWQPAPIWPPSFGVDHTASSLFAPDPFTWDGEGFQGFALQRTKVS